jgi:hypothetical protein
MSRPRIVDSLLVALGFDGLANTVDLLGVEIVRVEV